MAKISSQHQTWTVSYNTIILENEMSLIARQVNQSLTNDNHLGSDLIILVEFHISLNILIHNFLLIALNKTSLKELFQLSINVQQE